MYLIIYVSRSVIVMPYSKEAFDYYTTTYPDRKVVISSENILA